MSSTLAWPCSASPAPSCVPLFLSLSPSLLPSLSCCTCVCVHSLRSLMCWAPALIPSQVCGHQPPRHTLQKGAALRSLLPGARAQHAHSCARGRAPDGGQSGGQRAHGHLSGLHPAEQRALQGVRGEQRLSEGTEGRGWGGGKNREIVCVCLFVSLDCAGEERMRRGTEGEGKKGESVCISAPLSLFA